MPVFLKDAAWTWSCWWVPPHCLPKWLSQFPRQSEQVPPPHTLLELDSHLLNLCYLGYYWGRTSVIICHLYLVFAKCLFMFCIRSSIGIFLSRFVRTLNVLRILIFCYHADIFPTLFQIFWFCLSFWYITFLWWFFLLLLYLENPFLL